MKRQVGLYTLRRKNLEVQITNFGAKITRLLVPDKQGAVADVVLGFGTINEWQTLEPSFNAVIGRFANRIKNGQFTLDGNHYQLPINCAGNTLHGGLQGFHQKVWEVVGQSAYSITLHYCSPAGEEGFPGKLDIYVTYQLTRENGLRISYEAKTDAPTIVNFTNHAYFNLNGENSPSVRNHTLQIVADMYTHHDETGCPDGLILPVADTAMDFRNPVCLGDRMDDPFFAATNGIDNNWVLRKPQAAKHMELAAILSTVNRTMQVWTTQPGMQVYTGNWVAENRGKSGSLYGPHNSICLETQNFPDAPNHPNFPNAVLRPGEIFFEQTEYRFV